MRPWPGLLLVVLTTGCAHSTGVEGQLTTAKAELMRADYRADLPGLGRLRERVVPLESDAALGYLARYWAGYASWRIALNGASKGMDNGELQANLERALADFEAAIRVRADFADGYAASASVSGWLTAFHRNDIAAVRADMERAASRMARAKELAPDNLRVLWVEASFFLFRPAAYGGDPEHAVAVYKHMLEVAGPLEPSSAFPDWGKPEALMSLAFAQFSLREPDLVRADEDARAALGLVPDWFYVKDILIPRIATARAEKPRSP
jgi:hypothetical protein